MESLKRMRFYFVALLTIVIIALAHTNIITAQGVISPDKIIALLDSAKNHRDSDLEKAEVFAKDAFNYSFQLQNDSLIGKSSYALGLIKYFLAKYNASTNYYRRALETNTIKNNPLFASACWNNIGVNYDTQSMYQEAIYPYLQSLKLAESTADSTGIFQTYINLGYLYSNIFQNEKAYQYLFQAEKYFLSTKDDYNLGLVNQNFAIFYEKILNFRLAHERNMMAAEYFTKAGAESNAIQCGLNKISFMIKEGIFNRIGEELEQLMKRIENLDNPILMGSAYGTMANYYINTGSYDKAKDMLALAENIYKELGAERKILGLYKSRIILFSHTGETQKVIEAVNNYESLVEVIFNSETSSKFAEYNSIYEDEKKTSQLVILNNKLQAKNQIITLWILLSIIFIAGAIVILILYLNIRKKRNDLLQKSENLKIAKETAEKLAEEEKTLRSKAEEENRQKNEILSIVSHDLKNPVFGVIGLTEILEEDGELNPRDREYLQMIGEAGQKMKDLITQFLNFSTAEGNNFEPHYISIDPVIEIKKISQGFLPAASKKSQNVVFESELSTPISIQVDPVLFNAIFDNLISNAIKFSKPGSDILLKIFIEQEKLNISVKDFGPGFSEEDKVQMFQPFKKLSATPTANEPSSGIGLSVVKRFVNLNRAEMRLNSTMGEGAEFIISFKIS